MTETRNPGCAVWVALAILMSMIFVVSGTQLITYSGTSNTTPTPSIIIETLVPQETYAYFAVENNQIGYGYSQNLGMPCYYEMVGRVLDLNLSPYTAFVVNIAGVFIEGAGPERGYAFPGEGGYAEDGPSGWGSLLPAAPITYEVWLTTKIGGEELSPHILITPHDCYHNEAQINFIQVKPLPTDLP